MRIVLSSVKEPQNVAATDEFRGLFHLLIALKLFNMFVLLQHLLIQPKTVARSSKTITDAVE